MMRLLDYVLIDEGEFRVYPGILPHSRELFDQIMASSRFSQNQIRMFGKVYDVPRLEAWHGKDPYTYSGIRMNPQPMSRPLSELAEFSREFVKEEFNSCLVNLYRNGEDYVSYHADDEPELGEKPTIVSISLGASRKFYIRKKNDHRCKKTFILEDGDVVVMKGDFQTFWEHSVPKSKKVDGPRINITFRKLHL